MNPLQPVMTLLTQCERERDELAVACQRAAMSHRSATAQADQLVVYRGEYEQRWAEQFKTDGRMELVNCYRGFMDELPKLGMVDGTNCRVVLRDAQLDIGTLNTTVSNERKCATAAPICAQASRTSSATSRPSISA
jgi:hypothetical protein